MSVEDLWLLRDGRTPSKRYGRGKRWRVRWPGQPAKSFKTKTEAVRHESRIKTVGAPALAGKVTVAELVDLWLAGKAGLSPDGQGAVKAAAVRVHARWGQLLAGQVEHHEIQAWVATMTAARRLKGRPAMLVPASHDTQVKALACLRGALQIAVDRGDLKGNPAVGVKTSRLEQRDARFLEVDELGRLADAVGSGWSAMVWLLGTTGVRVGECCALLVGDVDPKRRRLRVRRSKSGRARDTLLTASVSGMLELSRPPSAWLFTGPRGAAVDPDNFRARVFRPAAQKAGLPDLRIHDLRHTAASLMIASGASIKDVQAALGHKSAKMTLDLYGHRFPGHLADLAKRMDVLLG